jgi:electron transfer flavoprotein alpha subunit
MSVLIYTENWEGKFKKISFELASYASELAKQAGTQPVAVSLGKVDAAELEKLGQYGITKVLSCDDARFASMDNKAVAKALAAAAKQLGAKIVVLAHNNLGKAIAPRLSVKLGAGMVSAVVGLPVSFDPFKVKKMVFTGKAFGEVAILSENKVLTLAYNSFGLVENPVSLAVESFDPGLSDSDFATKVLETNKVSGKVLLNEADIVVSGGRGMKAPENWHLIETLAEELGAGTACSRPISDEGWRPHGEHVGQTGKIIAPNLYFAFRYFRRHTASGWCE